MDKICVQAIDALSAHLCVLDNEGVILFVNKAWKRFAEENPPVPAKYCVGENYLRVCENAVGENSSEAKPFAEGIRAVLRGDLEVFEREYPCHSPGKENWFIGRVTRFTANKAVHALIIHFDSTQRYRILAALQSSEMRHRAVFEYSPLSIALTRISDGILVEVNKAWEQTTGFAREEAVGHSSVELGLYAEPDVRREIIGKLIAGGLDAQVELRLREKSGKIIDLLFSAALITLAGEEYLLSMALDITVQKRLALEVAHTAQRYKDLSENSGTNIVIVDENGVFLLANRKAALSFGTSPVEIVGKSMFDLLSEATARRYIEFNRELLRTGGRREYEDTFDLPIGRRSFLIIDQALKDPSGRNNAIQSSSIDITNRKRTEDDLKTSNLALQSLAVRQNEIRDVERKRLALEVHDVLGQLFTALRFEISALISNGVNDIEDLILRAQSMLSLVDQGTKTVQDISSALHSRLLDDLGLVPALEWEGGEFQRRTGIRCTWGLIPPADTFVDRDHALEMYRVFQEALTNVARHASASEVSFHLLAQPEGLTLIVEDNGVGIREELITSPTATGLWGMRERLRRVGGRLSIARRSEGGTRISAFVPPKVR
jgi:PAS domain S-box-containing protein